MNNKLEELKRIVAELKQFKAVNIDKEIEGFETQIAELEKEAKKPKEKGYTWEECFSGRGFYSNSASIIEETIATSTTYNNNNIATTEKVCKSHLAACQLSHIIERLNEDFGGDENYCVVFDKLNNEKQGSFYYSYRQKWALPMLKSYLAFAKLVETNTPLLKQYFGIE